MVIAAEKSTAILETARFLTRMARTPRRRSMRRFAEEEIVLTSGPFEGRNYRCSRQPFTGLWLDALDSAERNGWNRFAAVGPSQSGKTVAAFHIPLLYHLFEIGERVICALPDENIAAEKWFLDILPMIQRTRYRELLPQRGGGSRGGKVELIQFGNGASLKFMTAGGDDKSRAHYTARVVVATEVDGMDTGYGGSRESDPMTQIETRTKAYGERKRVYLECTASTEEGRIWKEWRRGTGSRVGLHCPHCAQWHAADGTDAERKLLAGWEDAEDELSAREGSAFHCPKCGERWTEEERRRANEEAVLVHRGQEVGGDGLTGPIPRSRTFSFRWSAVNNLFLTAAEIGAAEWQGRRAGDEDKAERELSQFIWGLPHKSALVDLTPLDQQAIVRRQHKEPRGVAPAWTQWITVGVDLGKWMGWYWTVAWRDDGRGAVIDYGRLPLATEQLGEQQATRAALLEFADLGAAGWNTPGGQTRPADRVWVDSNYAETRDVVLGVCRERWPIWVPIIGRGGSQYAGTTYKRPRQAGGTVVEVGEGYHFVQLAAARLVMAEIDADTWKSWIQERFTGPTEAPGAITLYNATPNHHLLAARHLTAERKCEEFKPGLGGGMRFRWEKIRGDNHLLDCAYMAAAAAHWLGARVTAVGGAVTEPRSYEEPPTIKPGMTMPDGRPYLVTDRR